MPVVPTIFQYVKGPDSKLFLYVETLNNFTPSMSSFEQGTTYYITISTSEQIITTIIIKSILTETRLQEICKTDIILSTDFAFSKKMGGVYHYLISVTEHLDPVHCVQLISNFGDAVLYNEYQWILSLEIKQLEHEGEQSPTGILCPIPQTHLHAAILYWIWHIQVLLSLYYKMVQRSHSPENRHPHSD